MNRTRIPAVFLGIALIGSSAIAQTVSPNRPIKDFIGISFTCRIPMVLVVNPSSSARIVRDLVDLAKSKEAALSYGSSGNGSTRRCI